MSSNHYLTKYWIINDTIIQNPSQYIVGIHKNMAVESFDAHGL